MNCKICKDVQLNSLLEQEQELCVPCIKSTLSLFDTMERNLKKSEEEKEILAARAESALAKFERIKLFMDAEREGVAAAESGVGEDQNPYTEDKQLSVFWLNGWQVVMTQKVASKTLGVIQWATDNIEHIIELSQGYDMPEIKSKLEFVNEKMRLFRKEI